MQNGYGLALFYTNKLNDDWRIRFRAGYTRDNYDSYEFSAPDSTGINKKWIGQNIHRDAWRVAAEMKYRDFEFAYNYGELKDLQYASYLDNKQVKEKDISLQQNISSRQNLQAIVNSVMRNGANKLTTAIL